MKDTVLFQQALCLPMPWFVKSSAFDIEQKRLTIQLDFQKGSTFSCPTCGQHDLKAYDTAEKQWRHLNFFQHECYLTARVPRISCPTCGVKAITDLPWARRDSGFTLLFEAMIIALVPSMPCKTIANYVGEHDSRIWRIIHYYLDEALEQQDLSAVTKVGLDETASKRGHNYVTSFVDLESSKVLFVTEGKDATTVEKFHKHLLAHKGKAENIKEICCDMSPAFIKGVTTNFPETHITFDKFHIIQVLTKAVDEVRREEQKERPELAKSRYLWLKNQVHLNQSQQVKLEKLQLKKLNLKTARAYQVKLNFQEFFKQAPAYAQSFLNQWYYSASHSRLEPIKEAARTIKRHWYGILRWFTSNITNGKLEGLNSMIQAAKARARGYRTTNNLIAMIYFIGSKFEFTLPALTHSK
uniref:Transposase n=1 Tax=Chlorobium chlorochromatii (strain CaD3) TaxID=340177 RepID=Q3AT05_CHLCH